MDEFTRGLFCADHTGCAKCPACLKIKAACHPDILKITPSGKSIKVEDIENVGEWIARKPYEGGYKTVVIPDADSMVDAVQNKLLKAIEEPPEKTVFLLGTISRKNLLPTVLSRCIIVRMQSNDGQAVIRDLQKKFDLSTMGATALARTARLDPYAAAELYKRNYAETRETGIRAVKRLLDAKNRATSVILDLLMKYAENLDDIFLAMECFIRDIIVYKNTGDDALLYNTDKIVDIKEYAGRLPDAKLVRILGALQAAQEKKKICTGILKKLLLENMLFEILEVVLT